MITLTCDKCEKLFETDDDAAGGKVSCPYCGDVNVVPRSGAPVAAPAVAPASAAPAAPAAPVARPSPQTDSPERIVEVVRQGMFRAHPLLYLIMVLIFLSGAALAVIATSTQLLPPSAGWMVWVGVALMAIGFLWWLGWWAAPHRWIKLTITNKRVIRQEGIFMHTTNEVLHRHITDIVVKQTLLERILNVGYIGVDCAGQGGNARTDEEGKPLPRGNIEIEMHNIPRPMRVKETINRFRLH